MTNTTHQKQRRPQTLAALAISTLLILGATLLAWPAQADTSPNQRGPRAADTPTPIALPTAAPTAAPTSKPNPPTGYADPFVIKTANAAPAKIGDTVEFTIVAGNNGTVDAVNVQVRDGLPNYLDVVSVSASRGTVSVNGRTILVDIGTIAPKELITIKLVVRINASAQPGTGFNVTVLNTTSGGDEVKNNTSGATFLIGTEVTLPVTGGATDASGIDAAMTQLGFYVTLAGIATLGLSIWAGLRR